MAQDAAMPFVTRFAPSPTGRMHAGNIFTFLVTWLLAKRNNGRVVLRIEDLDKARSRAEYATLILKDFERLGLTWDGEVLYQSSRKDAYRHSFDLLASSGEIYPCFCTRASLHAASAPHKGDYFVYPLTCYGKRQGDIDKSAGTTESKPKKPSMRIHVPDKSYNFDDFFQGLQHFNLAADCGDFVLIKNDGGFAYQLAVVVDDAFQEVTHVVRARDLLQSTPQQCFLLQQLHLHVPQYCHVPLFIDETGRRIAKRNRDASLDELLSTYRSYERIIGHIAFVAGLIDCDDAVTPQQLIETAHLDALRGKKTVLWN